MKHLLIVVFAIVLYSCGNKKKNECLRYFESKQQQITARDSAMNHMMDTLTDLPEDDNAVLFMNLMIEGDAQKRKDAPGPEGNGFQPDPRRTFMVYIERIKEKPFSYDFTEGDADFRLYYRNTGYKLLQMGDDVRSGILDCYTDTVNVLKKNIDDYLGMKWLVVADCIFYKAPKMDGERSYSGGIISKQIRIYDINTGKELNRLYVTARSSEKLDIRYNANNKRLNNDLLENFAAKLKGALINNKAPEDLNRF